AAGGGNTNSNNSDPFVTTDDGASLGVDLIGAALSGGANVVISTGTGGATSAAGNITWDAAATLDYNGKGDNSLTLNAHNDIVFNGTITDSDSNSVDRLNVLFNANSDGAGGGNVVIGVGSSINTGGGHITLKGEGITLSGLLNAGAGIARRVAGALGINQTKELNNPISAIIASALGVISEGSATFRTDTSVGMHPHNDVDVFAAEITGVGSTLT